MNRRDLAAITASICILTAGCSPITLGARAIQPSQAVDTHEAWIYLQTNDAKKDGVYRCYDNDRKPQCLKAELVTK